jgi:nucleotide-binding universal stress UspA family protein
MEKILVAFNYKTVNTNVLDFACYLADLTGSEITALLLEQEEAIAEKLPEEASPEPAVLEKKVKVQPVVSPELLIETFCRNRGVRMRLRRDSGEPVSTIVSETRFADMLVIDRALSPAGKAAGIPSDFARTIMAGSECPVVIAPHAFSGVEEIVFAYDGSASSLFAMKQFTYLFPEFSDMKLTILQVSDEYPGPLMEKQKVIEFLQMHYSYIGFRILEGKASEELQQFLQHKKRAFVVMGSFGRSKLSNIIKPSTADLLLKTVNTPLFIAHKG